MNVVSGYMGYPNQFQVTANPTGAALTQLNSNFARDFGLGYAPVYDLPMTATAGYGGMYGMGMGMGMMGGMMGMRNPQFAEYLNLDFKDRLDYDADLRAKAREIQYNEGKASQNYASATDGLTGSIREACNTLQTVVIEGESDQVVAKFEEIVNMLRRSPLYTRLQEEFKDDNVALEKTLRNCAREQFHAVTGQDLKAMIQQNCDGALANSFWNSISFGHAQKFSAEEIIARMEGSEPPISVRTKKTFGKIGSTTATTAAGAAIGWAVGGPIGFAIGTIAGLGVGIFGAISK